MNRNPALTPTSPDFPDLGIGIGLRAPHFADLLEGGGREIRWLEAISENYMIDGGRPLETIERLRVDRPVVLHGVSLSIGSTAPLDVAYLARLRALARHLEAAWVSDHLCWTGVHGRNLHDLLPLPLTEETLAHVAERVERVQDALGRRLVVENVSSYLQFRHSTMREEEFLAALVARSGCALLLDVNNVHVSAFNHRFDPIAYLDAIPLGAVAQIHLAGPSDRGTHLLDTHDAPVPELVWSLYRHAIARFGAIATSIEWDANIPPLARLEQEAARAVRERAVGLATRATSVGERASGAHAA